MGTPHFLYKMKDLILLANKITNRKKFRSWLVKYANKEKQIYLILKRGEPKDNKAFCYLDAVEEALCFGWIDSTLKRIDDQLYQCFTPRKPNSHWTELNKERARRLIKLNLMTKLGEESLPKDLNKSYVFDKKIINKLKKEGVYKTFTSFPELYQRIRIDNLVFYRIKDKEQYKRGLNNLIKNTKENKMYGEWNDYGRLLKI